MTPAAMLHAEASRFQRSHEEDELGDGFGIILAQAIDSIADRMEEREVQEMLE